MKKLILLISILALTLGLFATELIIGTGTVTQRFPLGSYFGFERSAALYTAAEIGAQNTRISSVSWYSEITTAAAVPTKIYMKTTSAGTLTTDTWDNMIVGATLLYDQTLTGHVADGWNLFELTGTFDVDMGDNLMILVERNFGAGGAGVSGGQSNGGKIRSTPIPGTHLTWGKDTSPPIVNGTTAANRPNVTLTYSTYTIDTPPNPAIAFSPANAAIEVRTAATLNWGSGGGGPTGYSLYFGTDNPPTNLVNGTDLGSVNTYNPDGLNRSSTYYWQVVPYNANGLATGCPVWTFSTLPEGLVIIGEGALTTLKLPLNSNYEYNYTQVLYLQNEIDISGQRIEKLYYNWNGYEAGTNLKDWTIYMGHTDKAAFATTTDWVPFEDMIQVFSGEVNLPATAGWIEITLTMPFVYNNTDNLVIAVNETGPGSNNSLANFYGSSSTTNRGLRLRSDSTVYDPAAPGTGVRVLGIANIRMQFADPPTSPILSVNPEDWDFGTVLINSSTLREFTISNTGAGLLNVSSLSIDGTGFTLTEAFSPIALSLGESARFTVNFEPIDEGPHTGTVTINSNIDPVQISLIGDCFDPTVYSIPWTEGFEDGNTDGTAVLGWIQEGISGSYEWTANSTGTSYNRTPHTGDWNAYLRYSNTRWMFKPVQLQAETDYRISLWARQNTSSGATLSISYGTEASETGMTDSILESTAVISGDYQKLHGTFSPGADGIYYIGILGDISGSPWYISIDDITIEIPQPIAPEAVSLDWPSNGITTLLNPLLQWTPAITGEPAGSYKVYMNNTGTFAETDVIYEGNDSSLQTIGMDYGQTYRWKVAAVNAYGATDSPTWTFNSPGAEQLAEGFEGDVPPTGWANGTTGNWTRSTSTPLFEGAASAYKFTSTSNVYVLSTPLLDIEGGSTLDFYTRASNTSQILQIVYSDDRINWTQIGADVTYDATGIWYPVNINLGSLPVDSYYIGFQTPTQTSTGSIYIDYVTGPNHTPVLPGAVSLNSPADAATGLSNYPALSWTPAATGGVPAGYNIYMDTVDGSTFFDSTDLTSYTANTALAWDTTYYWKVAATNIEGIGEPSAVRSFTTSADQTIYVDSSVSWLEGFGTTSSDTFPPLHWSRASGLYPTIDGTLTQWVRDDWLNITEHPNNAAKINIYGTGRKGWLITPPVDIPADGYGLSFDLCLTRCGYVEPILDDTSQQDDRFIVAMATNPNMSDAVILGEWNNTGSELVFNQIPYTGTSVNYTLEGITGTRYFAFYGESTLSGGDNDLMVDNVMVRKIPAGAPDPVTLFSPENGATNMPTGGFDLTWAPANTGGEPVYYELYIASSAETIYEEEFFDNIAGTSFDPVVDGGMTFNYGQRWFWTVQAVNTFGAAVADPPYYFDIIGSPAQISVNPLTVTETLEYGDSSIQVLTIENAGGQPLDFRISFKDTTPRSSLNPEIGNIVSGASAALNAEKSPLASRNSIDASRAQLDLQFAYPTAMNTGEYGVASDGDFIYTARWSSPAGALQIYKYDLEGNYLEEIIISGANGVRDLAYDGTYFYGAATATTIYQMDFDTATLIGTIIAPVPVRAITYDPDNDAFWVSNNWDDPLQLVDRSGTVLRTLDTDATDFAGMAYDNLSGNPSIWVNSQVGSFFNTLVQVSLADGSIIQSLPLNDTIIPGITATASAGGVEIVSGIVHGTATILGVHQNQAIYGFELCPIATWVNADPSSGSVDAAGNIAVNIDFDANNVVPGVHTGIFTINHNADTAPVMIPVSLTVTGEWLPVFAINPVQWDFTDVELMNPAAKEFTIHNSGGPGLSIASGDIYISADIEGNFSVVADNLPANLAHNANYSFNVLFTPQSLGAKTATLNVEDNLGRVLHSYPLSGNGIDEPIGQVVNLSAEVQDLSNVMLNWGVASSEPGEPAWLKYDNGINADGIGTGGIATFNVAIKYTGADLWNYDGMQIEKIKFFPRSANTNYSLRIWTGNDVSLAPATLMYSQDLTLPTIGAWNEIVLDTPFPIVQGQALWFGYYCDVLDGEVFHPAGCDAGPAVVGKGDLIELGGTWYSMYNQYNINANWNLQAYVNDPSILSKTAPQWLNIPVTNLEPSREALSNLRLSTSGNPTPSQRALRGFNIYRDGNPINAEIVAAYSYLDEGLAAGTYNYAVQPVYFSANGAISNPVSITVDPPPLPHALPFTEDWASADFETNLWTSGSANWLINSSTGNPEPSASFSWTPQVTNYSIALNSYEFDATGLDNVQFSFDLYLNNFSTDAENVMIWEIWDGSSWNTLGGYSSLNDDLAWTRFAYDISAYASNRVFKIRFVASGEDSYEINFWYIDNIHLAELPATVDPVTDLSIARDGANVVLSWTAVPEANWYYIYTSENPYSGFVPLGFVETAGISLPGTMLPAGKAFIKVTAGAGPFPSRGERLTNAPAAKRK